jgi:hypothetical protein
MSDISRRLAALGGPKTSLDPGYRMPKYKLPSLWNDPDLVAGTEPVKPVFEYDPMREFDRQIPGFNRVKGA